MKVITCTNCRQEVEVVMYLYDERIFCHDNTMHDYRYYEASVCGRAICPSCGSTINEKFRKTIYPEDIIKLAGGRD